MTTPATILAAAFCSVLAATLDDAQMRAVRAGRADPDDFCDANMAMDAAFQQCFGRESWRPSHWEEEGTCTEAECDADLALWNDAWGIAKASGFALVAQDALK